MATDSVQVPQGENTTDRIAEANAEIVQLAQAGDVAASDSVAASSNAAQVNIPVGQNLVRVPVAPGEVIDLPFDGDLSARFGEQGNLAIKLGDRTIILENYAGANQQEGVVLKDSAGHEIDVASVIAQTDPNLDIQTAAGSSAAGGTSGSGFFSPFGNAGGLGGLGELGVLGETELQYGLIQPDTRILITGNNANGDTPAAPAPADGTLDGHVVTIVEGEGRISGSFDGMFEDWRPNQHLGNQVEAPTQLIIAFSSTTSVLDYIVINALPDGVQIFVGDLSAPVATSGSGLPLTISAADLGKVWIKAGADKGTDFDLAYDAHIHNTTSGQTAVLHGDIHVIVDAVADQPTDLTVGHQDANENGYVTPGEKVTLTFSAKFGDITDGSETHYLLIKVPAGWAVGELPEGVTHYTVTDESIAHTLFGVEVGDYIQLPASVDSATGIGTASLVVTAPTNLTSGDNWSEFVVVAQSIDHESGPGLVDTNNESYQVERDGIHVEVAPVAEVTGEDKHIVVNVSCGHNNPDGNPFIGDLLSEGRTVDPAAVAGNVPVPPVLTYDGHVTAEYVSGEAGYHNVVGWYVINPDGTVTEGHVLWANASGAGNGHSAGDTVDIGNLPAGSKIGFFMIPDGYSVNDAIPATVYFFEGRAYADAGHTQLIKSTDNGADLGNPVWFTNSELNLDGKQHGIQGISSDGDGYLYVGFEDQPNGDWDFNDTVFRVNLGEGNSIVTDPAVLQPNFTLSDVDSTKLTQAVVQFTLGDGDIVQYDGGYAATHGLTVTKSGDTYTITGTVDLATYQAFLNTFKIIVGHSGDGNDYWNIDQDTTRVVDVKVTDPSGLESNLDEATFKVDVSLEGTPCIPQTAALVVDEAHLATGTAPGASALTVSGSFKLPVNFHLDADVLANGVQLDNGKLTFSVNGNIVTYTFTLDHNYLNSASDDGVQTIHDANSYSLKLDGPMGQHMDVPIHIDIVDDAPIAVDDHFGSKTAQVAAEQSIGNLLDNDKAGADGYGSQKIVAVENGTDNGDGSWTIVTNKGTIHISANGDVTFDAKSGTNYGNGTAFNFTYTIEDADGDRASANADFTVKNPARPGTPETSPLVVNEANLVSGTNPNSGALTVSNSFTLPAGYTLAAGMLGGHTLPNGTLTISVSGNVVTYTYMLTSAYTNASANDGAQTIQDANHYNVVLEGPFGGQITVPVRVDIVDDRPVAVDDHFGAKTAQVAAGLSIGNLLGNDKAGADGYGSQKIVAVTGGVLQADGSWVITKAEGTIHISANGDVTFDAKAGTNYGNGTAFNFSYTIEDADGDRASANADFTVKNPATPGTPETSPLVVNEANLSTGTNPNSSALTVSNSFTLPAGYTLAAGMLGDHSLPNGTLTISVSGNVVTYTYKLTSAYTNASANDGVQTITDANHYNVVLEGPFGGQITVPVRVDIVDDRPVAVDDHFGAKTAQVAAGLSIGNLLGNDKAGADGYGSQKIVAVTGGVLQLDGSWVITKPEGTIRISANGDVTFDVASGYNYGTGKAFDFTYTIEDADGDRSSAKADFTVQNPAAPEAPIVPHLVVDEGNLSTGTHPNTGALTVSNSFTLPSGCTLAPGMVGTHDLPNGTLTISVSGDVVTYTYKLTSAYQNATKDDGVQTIQDANHYDISLKGPQGQDLKVSVAIDIKDDAPKATNDTVSVNTNSPAYNLLFVIDTSGSMNDPSGVGNLTRLQLEQQALVQMLQSFAAAGVPIQIQIVSFDASATSSKVFTSVGQAQTYINGLTAGGNTNYDDAIAKAQAATVFDNAAAGATNLVYFLSDGKPNRPSNSVGLNATELSAWKDFLNTHDASAVAVGVGKGDIDYGQLNGISTNGQAVHAENPNTLVTDLTSVLPGTVSGNVLSNDAFGADGGSGVYQLKLTYNGSVVTFDQNSAVTGHVLAKTAHTLTIETAGGGKLVFNFDSGDYTYIPPVSSTNKTEDITYVIRDSDGDTSSAHLIIDVNATTHVTVPYTPDYSHATQQGSTHIIDGVIYTDAYGDNKNNNLKGSTSGHNWIDGRDGDDTLTAGKYGDVLIGGAGHDKFVGGAGNDTIVIDKDDLFTGTKLNTGAIVDGKGGYNRLVFDFDLDTTKLNNKGGDGKNTLNHLDILDMNDGKHQELILSKEAVNAMLNHDKTLFVQADGQDTVKLSVSDSWVNNGTAQGNDGHTYIHYTSGTGSNTIHLYVDHEATVLLS